MAIERPEPVRQLLRDFGARLRELRRGSGETAEGLFRRCGLDTAYLRKLERGDVDPRLSMLSRLALAFNVPPQALLPTPSAPAYAAAVPAEAPAGTEASTAGGTNLARPSGDTRIPVDPAAAAGETAAYREAAEAFVKIYTERVRAVGLGELANTEHIHRGLLLDDARSRAAIITIHISFSRELEAAQLTELIAHAQGAPGTVPEA